MARALSAYLRRRVVDLFEQGVTKSEIARRLKINRGSVISLLKRYANRGIEGLRPDYKNCGPQGPRTNAFIVRAYCCLRRWHPLDGYDRISSQLYAKYGKGFSFPDRSTVYRWWHAKGLVKAGSLKQPADPPWTNKLHDVWQVDAKEKMTLADGSKCCWLNVVDEASGVVVDPPVFSIGGICQVKPHVIQKHFIAAFTKWGQPLKIKVDNGRPLGDPSRRMIPLLALWFIGIGVDVIYNPPRSPQKNGKVERSQGVLGRWTDFTNCPEAEVLQWRLAQESHFYNHTFRDRRHGHQTKKQRFPNLENTGRAYHKDNFDIQLVYNYLSARNWQRRVSSAGQINHANQRVYIGKKHIGQLVNVSMDANIGCWTVSDYLGEQLASYPFEFSAQEIRTLGPSDGL